MSIVFFLFCFVLFEKKRESEGMRKESDTDLEVIVGSGLVSLVLVIGGGVGVREANTFFSFFVFFFFRSVLVVLLLFAQATPEFADEIDGCGNEQDGDHDEDGKDDERDENGDDDENDDEKTQQDDDDSAHSSGKLDRRRVIGELQSCTWSKDVMVHLQAFLFCLFFDQSFDEEKEKKRRVETNSELLGTNPAELIAT